MTLAPSRQPLTPWELQGRLQGLDWSVQAFANATATDSHTACRWLTGEAPIPRWVCAFLDLAAENRDLEYSLREVDRKRAELVKANRALFTG
jgi:hypothetical protein